MESLNPDLAHTVYQSVCKRIKVTFTGTAFVDDSALGIILTYQWNDALSPAANQSAEVSHFMRQLRRLAQHWERLLFSTGGQLTLTHKNLTGA